MIHGRKPERGQIVVLLAVAMIGLLAMAALAIDGGMLFWNQRRAQNAADAAVIAGVSELADAYYANNCGSGSEQPILDAVYAYAANNEVPGADSGDNVAAYYLVRNLSGDFVELQRTYTVPDTTPGAPDGSVVTVTAPWEVGATGSIPCGADPDGLRVVTSFPQPTFMAGVIGIAETNVTVDASAIHTFHNWCTGFAIVALSDSCQFNTLGLTGSDVTVYGGMHSNGGMQIGGGGGGISLQPPGAPITYGEECSAQITNPEKIEGGPDPEADDLGITGGEPLNINETNIGYKFEEFQTGGLYARNLTAGVDYFDFGTADIRNIDVKDPSTGKLIDGLYVTEGDIKLSKVTNAGEDDIPWNVTFVTTGTIEISGGFTQYPFTQDIFILTFSNNLAPGAVNLSGDSNEWAGLILAPNGLVSVSGAQNSDLQGMIVGYEVDASGSNMSITHQDEMCPANPVRVLLVE